MTIHMIRFRSSADTNSYLVNSYLPQWLIGHTPWSEANNQAPELVTSPEGTEYYAADWRFDWSAAKSVLTANLVAYTQSYQGSWYRIQYHECDHDEESRQGCTWDDEWTAGTIPPEIQ